MSPGDASPTAVQATSTGSNGYGGVDFSVPSGLTVTASPGPFKNQGDCVSYFATGGT